MNLADIRALVESDFQATNQMILDRLKSDVALVDQVGHYIVAAGGKRLRPMLVLLAAKSMGYEGSDHAKLAAVIELIHTSTLLHDDVVDESSMRRGRETANELFGNQASVLVGDFLYSRSFQMMVEVNNMKVLNILADTTNQVAAGEVLQLMNIHDPEVSEEGYYQVIERKTAILFAAATQLGAVLTNASSQIEKGLRTYGLQLGIAFQLIDDALDYAADAEEMGKNVGDDLAEGKPTLPLIYALTQSNSDGQAVIRAAIEQGGLDDLDRIMSIVKSTNAIEYTYQAAEKAVKKAIDALTPLPESAFKTALVELAKLSLNRNN
ncbi:polyprenyl synthetase family protein [Kangiella sediminilitoris]|uniref:Octaprenyl diphosphate synthase n=1 Tax=Kangiella sediminilitoris TaxID=1144748 RepID=A0A1B3BBD4_9GAMM|nr:polyprenyl synthetase family protein [Kangiella sediminilitoris]AOE50111.1 Polyprenyl synthetase [Kangiella sediminilitoris]